MIFAALVGHNPLEITLRQAQGDFSLDASYDIFPNAIALMTLVYGSGENPRALG